MELRQSTFHGWPAWTLRQGALALHVVPAVGGRLMGIECEGTELCFIHPGLAGKTADDDATAWRQLCGDWAFPLWGGGKTWVAPESAWPGGNPQRDLDSGPYRVLRHWCDASGAGIELESPVCRQSGLQIRRRIGWRAGEAGWSVTHTLTNTAPQAVACGIWDVLMLRRPGRVAIALKPDAAIDAMAAWRAIPGQGELDQLAGQGIIGRATAFASTSAAMAGLLVQCQQPRKFKVGVAGASGSMAVQLDLPEGSFQYWRTAPAPAATYAHGHPVEVFNAPGLAYFEVESHSPLHQLAPGAHMEFVVTEGAAVLSTYGME